MNELDWLLTVVVGVILPPFAAYLTTKGVNKNVRVILGWGIAAVVAVIWAGVTSRLGTNWPTAETIGVILMATQTAYDRVWKPLGAAAGGLEAHKLVSYAALKLTGLPTPK